MANKPIVLDIHVYFFKTMRPDFLSPCIARGAIKVNNSDRIQPTEHNLTSIIKLFDFLYFQVIYIIKLQQYSIKP